MLTTTCSHARANLSKLIRKTCDDRAPVIITNKGRTAVLMSMEDYESMSETRHLLRNPKNARRLMESIAQIEAGNTIKKTIEELQDACR